MNVPMVIRVGAGAVRSAGPHHSGMYHPAWAHIPGLIVCLPSTPADAKGLMKTALRAGDPVLMLECKALFSSKGPVPVGEHFVPFGVARIARQGRDLTIVSAGQLVHRSLEAAAALAKEGVECEVIDLRTIQPLDVDTIAASVRRTHRLMVVDEGWAPFGVGAEVGILLRLSRCADRARAHRFRLPSFRAGAGARHAGHDRPYPRRRAARDIGRVRCRAPSA